MKILMIAPEPFFEPRGTPISILQRLRALSSLGYQVDLLTYHVGWDIHFPGLTIYRTPRLHFIREVKIGPSGAKLFLDVFLFLQAFWMLLTRRYDVLHSHEEASFFSMLLGVLFRVPHIYDMHSSLPRQLINYRYGYLKPAIKLFEFLERAVLHTAAAVITIDSELEEYIKQLNPAVNQVQIDNLPLNNQTQPVDPNAVTALRTRLAIDARRAVVYTGTLEPYQGLELAIEGAAIVRNQIPDVIYIIVGGKPAQIASYKALARAHHVDELFIFTGNVMPDEAIIYLTLADVLISPRRGNTSIPLKIYSYLASGRPILATRTESHTRLLHDDLALLVEPTADAFAHGIIRLLTDHELQAHLQRNAYQFAATIQNDTEYVTKVSQVYQSLPVSACRTNVPEHALEE
jgi:glycosyltransferase involved in cell wall biosynthesis